MRKGRPKVTLLLTTEERQRLESFAHRSRSAAALARRARIILACAEGTDSKVVARLVEKVRDIAGLYLDPPAHAAVFCVDERPQIQGREPQLQDTRLRFVRRGGT